MANVGLWSVDLVYRLRGTATLRKRPPAHYLQHVSAGKMPVIILSGLSLRWHFLRVIADRISQAGHPVHIIPALGRNMLPVADLARLVRTYILEQDLRRVVIVAHSKGGVVGKYLLAHDNADNRVEAVIAIASPFAGTRKAKLLPFTSAHELHNDSRLIQELQSLGSTVDDRIVQITPAADNIVDAGPVQSENAKTIFVKSRGHHRVVFDKQVADEVMHTLENL